MPEETIRNNRSAKELLARKASAGDCPREELLARLRNEIREDVLSRVDLNRQVADEEIHVLIQEAVIRAGRSWSIPIEERLVLERDVFRTLRGMDVLEEFMEDDEITEIMVNGPDQIFFEKNGRLCHSDRKFSSPEKLADLIQDIVGKSSRFINESQPIADTRLLDGSRVNIVIPPVSPDGIVLTIRRFPKHPYTMEDLIAKETLDQETAEFLQQMVVSGYNIFISGGTGSGKTTLLNALAGYIPREDRIVTIEDSMELSLVGAEHLVRLEARPALTDQDLEITIRDLVKNAMRMRPTRLIIGECRGAEALEVLTAMNTGHDGSLSTGHANSCRDMLLRLETMVLMGADLPIPAIRSQIAAGIDLFVHVGRMRDQSRKILEIAETDGMEDGQIRLITLRRYKGDQGWEKVNELSHTEKYERCFGSFADLNGSRRESF